ncbi:OmpA family protein [Alsobacter sp. R-9]
MTRKALLLATALVAASTLSVVRAQERLDDSQLIQTLGQLDKAKAVDVEALRKKAVDSVAANRGPMANLREPLDKELDDLAQLRVEILFQLGSSVIRPESFRAVGVVADALRHPSLQEYKFLIVGHTDATGGREFNLKLSEQRAAAVVEALVTTFGIAQSRLISVGLGEEQLQDRTHPDAAVNRRVQIINVGRFR